MSGKKNKFHLEDFSLRSIYRFSDKRRKLCEDSNEEEEANDVDFGVANGQNDLSSSGAGSEIENGTHITNFPDSTSNADFTENESDHEFNNDDDLFGEDWFIGNGEDEENRNNDQGHSSQTDENSDTDVTNDENEPYDNDGQLDDADAEDDEPQQDPDLGEDPLLFEGAPISQGESLTCILVYALRYSLPGVAIGALLELISMHCPAPNFCLKSLYLFKKYFEPITIPLRRQHYCSICYNILITKNSVCDVCLLIDPPNNNIPAYFVEVPILDQLKALYQRPGFTTLLKKRFRRNKQNMNSYEDIYDGEIYKELSQPGSLLSDQNNISFTWNTDGVKLFKSSKEDIWAFYLSINELPYTHRTRKENLLLAGLWFGKEKPLPSLFLKNICSDLDELKNGVDMTVPNENHPIRVHGVVICGTCDLPAKALFLNMKQFNAEYGCQKCEIQSQPCEPKSLVRVYPYKENLLLRTQEETDNYAREAEMAMEDNVVGVKGPSVISRFSKNYIRTTAVDSMHCVFLGVVRALLLLWFDSNGGLLSHFANSVDERICLITPPDHVSRLPRAIMEHIMYLKAHELKAWFFYYSIPVLQTIMSPLYFEHYILFVHSIYTLNQASISEEQISLTERLLNEFVSQYSDLYGARNMTANLHNLLHLPQNVRDFGPLWTTSCFPYENANGQIKKLVTGTKFAQLQICTGVSLFMNLPRLKENLMPNSPPLVFCEKLTAHNRRKYKTYSITQNVSVIGTMKAMNPLPQIVTQALQLSGINGTNIRIFQRLSISGNLYTSELYRRIARTNSMCVKYKINRQTEYGIIHCFTKVSDCNCGNNCGANCNARYFAIIKKCETELPFSVQPDILLSFIHRSLAITDIVRLVSVHELDCVCFYVKIHPENIIYIVEPVNILETE